MQRWAYDIIDEDGEKHAIWQTQSYLYISGRGRLAYWDDLYDVYRWACDLVCGPGYGQVLVDHETGEVYGYEDVLATIEEA